ncbi:hypothetical protein DXG03_007463 [Asterophora parasitica]|uniref:Uncharacterized protein n=1 Tax=Asterophora parasitica TaxID=117018 RepID=A0A9P7KEK1_9AGAR|nr:hypothetical protein DXG03_007463 [Asterophora parasitica]
MPRLSHPNVKWLDFWHTLRGYCDFDDDVHELLKRQSLPKLEYVREISASLDSIRNIPLIMNPRTSDFSSDAFEFRFPGVLLRYSTGIFTGGTHIDETDWDSDFYLDKDYTSSNDEVEDSDASWSQTSSECSPEDFVLGDAFDDASGSDASLEEICHGIDVVS